MTTLRVLGGGAVHGLVAALQPAFEAETGHRIEGIFGAVGAMRARLLGGEPVDVLILTRALTDELAREGHVAAASMGDIGTVETAIAVRAGDPLPAIGDAAALQAALRAADEIHFPDPQQATAGIHFAGVLRTLGISDVLASRLRPAPNGATAMRNLAASRAGNAIGCTQLTEIIATPGLAAVGSLPPGCALSTTYTAAVCTGAPAPVPAGRLVALLAGSEAADARRRAGFR
jgi:molybdate transport system substrate-binding protein